MGRNVLYMDDHVRFIKYKADGEFPINPAGINLYMVIHRNMGMVMP